MCFFRTGNAFAITANSFVFGVSSLSASRRIKFFSSEGFKHPESWEREIEELVVNGAQAFEKVLPKDSEIGKNARVSDADGRYIEFIKATFPRKLSLKALKIALDCANGAAYKVAPLVFRELDADVYVTANNPNGLNINDGCGALHPENVQKAVIDSKADIGIALDGDGDRVVLVDENAQIVDGDAILAICAKDMFQKGMLRSPRIVTTLMTNLGYLTALREMGIEVITSQVGDRYVLQEMLKSDTNLGGESSGHIIFLGGNVQYYQAIDNRLVNTAGKPTNDIRETIPAPAGGSQRIYGKNSAIASEAGVSPVAPAP